MHIFDINEELCIIYNKLIHNSSTNDIMEIYSSWCYGTEDGHLPGQYQEVLLRGSGDCQGLQEATYLMFTGLGKNQISWCCV